MYKTIDEFVNHEIVVWGWETVESLFNRGYRVIATNHGFRWILPLTRAPGCGMLSGPKYSRSSVSVGIRG
jgi:hypothetical protein